MIRDTREMREYFRRDLISFGFDSWKWRYRITKPELNFVRVLRRMELLRNTAGNSAFSRAVQLAKRLHFERLSRSLGYSIPVNVFGPGLSIAHVGTIVINGDARVGENCRLHPGVTIGSTRGEAPTCGDELFMAPGSGIFGGVRIGNRVHLGPGVVVTQDVDDDMLLLPPRPAKRERRHPTWWQVFTEGRR